MSDLHPQSKTPITDALHRLDDLPSREAEIGVVKTADDAGVVGRVSTPLGKGWSVAAAGQWMRDTGYAVAGLLKWKGK